MPPFLYPLPVDLPGDGHQIIVSYGIEWLPILMDISLKLNNPDLWLDPPDNLDEIIQEFNDVLTDDISGGSGVIVYPKNAFLHPRESYAISGAYSWLGGVINLDFIDVLWLRVPSAVGDSFAWRFPLAAGVYQLGISYVTLSTFGIVGINIMPCDFDYSLDMYSVDNTAVYFEAELAMDIDGECVVTMTVTGKNEASSDYTVGLAYMTVRQDISP